MESKPGYLTTEFWLTIFTAVFPLLNVVGIWNWMSNWHSGIMLTVLSAAYAVARGQAKSRVPFDPAAYAEWKKLK